MLRYKATSSVVHIPIGRSRNELLYECFQRVVNPEEMAQIRKIEVIGLETVKGIVGVKNKFNVKLHSLDLTFLTVVIQGPCEAKFKLLHKGAGGDSERGFRMGYKVQCAGNFLFHIKYRNFHVNGSPFQVVVEEPIRQPENLQVMARNRYSMMEPEIHPWKLPRCSSREVAVVGLPHNSYFGEIASFLVDTSKAGNGRLTVNINFEDEHDKRFRGCLPLPPYIRTENGWLINYVPPVEGCYTVEVKYEEENIPGSPFTCLCYGSHRTRSSGIFIPGTLQGLEASNDSNVTTPYNK